MSETILAPTQPGSLATTASPDYAVRGAFGPYRILAKIGEGGMGEVWLAEQTHPVRRRVVLRLIDEMASREVVSRFEADRQAWALMDHPAIATVFDGGTTPDGRPYLAMEYVNGRPITTCCDQLLLPTEERIRLFIQVCEGVQHAHQKGVVHRELKPSNILVTIRNDRLVPKIVSFGVAKAINQSRTERALYPQSGGVIGQPEYMSPEQADTGSLDIDTRADVYALGVVLYELLSGALPFDRLKLRREGLAGIRRMLLEEEPPKPSVRVTPLGPASGESAYKRGTEPGGLASLLRRDLDWITMRALEKDRERRYATASELAADLRRHLDGEPVLAGPPGTIYRARKFVRRHRFGVAMGATVMLLLLTLVVALGFQVRRIARERDHAAREAARASREATTARNVSESLVDLFQVSDPGEARGRTVTAREILSAGAARAGQSLQDQPEAQARLRLTIGNAYMQLGLYGEADPLLRQSVETHRRVLGDDHPDTLTALDSLAGLYRRQSRLHMAELLYVEIVERTKRTLGSEHRRTLKAKYDLAAVYLMRNRFDEAERLAFETLEVQRLRLGRGHPDTISSMSILQELYFRDNRYEDALPLAGAVVEETLRAFGPDHPSTMAGVHNLATVYDKLGRFGAAEQLYQDAIGRRQQVLGDVHPLTCRSRLSLGEMYRSQGRYSDAEPLLVKAHNGFTRSLGPRHPDTVDSGDKLSGLYKAWAKPRKAAQWKKKPNRPPAKRRTVASRRWK